MDATLSRPLSDERPSFPRSELFLESRPTTQCVRFNLAVDPAPVAGLWNRLVAELQSYCSSSKAGQRVILFHTSTHVEGIRAMMPFLATLKLIGGGTGN